MQSYCHIAPFPHKAAPSKSYKAPQPFTLATADPATQAAIIGATSLAFDSKGNLYLAHPTAHRIRRISPDGIITTVAGNGLRGPAVEGAIAERGPATGTAIGQINALAAAPDGSIYLADSTNARLRRLRPNGMLETVIGGLTATRPSPSASDPLAVLFFPLGGIAVDTQGRVYALIIGTNGARFYRLTPADKPADGKLELLDIPSPSDYYDLTSGADHRVLLYGYANPLSTLSESGAVTPVPNAPAAYYAATTSGTLYALNPRGLLQRLNGATLTTVAGSLFVPKNVDGGPAINGFLTLDIARTDETIASDADGNLLRVDSTNKQLWRITPAGKMQIIAGNGATTFDPTTQPAKSAALNFPTGVTRDVSGLYLNERAAFRRINAVGNLELVTRLDNLAPEISTHSITPSLFAVAADGTVYFRADDGPNGSYYFFTPGGAIQRSATAPYPVNAILRSPSGDVYLNSSGFLYRLNASLATRIPGSFPFSPATFTSPDSGIGVRSTGFYRFSLNTPAVPLNDPRLAVLSGLKAAASTPSGDVYLIADQNVFLLHRPQDCAAGPIPSTSPGGLVNAANFGYKNKISPGSVLTLFGKNLGPDPGFGGVLSGTGRALFNINGTSIGTGTFPVIYAASSQVSFITALQFGFVPVPPISVNVNGVIYPYPDPIQMVEATPALFTAGSTGSGQAASLNQDGSANSAANPIARSQIIQLFGTGFGALDGIVFDGTLATPPYPKLTLPIKIKLGDREATVEYAGAAPGLLLGIVQINIRIPADAPTGPAVPLTIQAGSTLAEQSVTIAIK